MIAYKNVINLLIYFFFHNCGIWHKKDIHFVFWLPNFDS